MRERSQRFDTRQNMHRQHFEVFHYRDPKPDGVEVHHHDFYEVYFLLGGDVSYWVEGQIYHLEPGDLLLINPMVLHRPVVAADSTLYERIVLWIDKNYLDHFAEEGVCLTHCFDSNVSFVNLLRPSSPMHKAELMAMLGELVRESYGSDYGSALYAEGVFLKFMVELNRMSMHSSRKPEEQKDSSSLVSRVLTYIGEHYSEDLSLEDLAQQFFVSKYHLSHEFSKTVGTGVYRYIMLKRLTVAKQFLSEGLSPGEVCSRCGFKDYTNFFRAFKAEYGISPRSFTSTENNLSQI